MEKQQEGRFAIGKAQLPFRLSSWLAIKGSHLFAARELLNSSTGSTTTCTTFQATNVFRPRSVCWSKKERCSPVEEGLFAAAASVALTATTRHQLAWTGEDRLNWFRGSLFSTEFHFVSSGGAKRAAPLPARVVPPFKFRQKGDELLASSSVSLPDYSLTVSRWRPKRLGAKNYVICR